MGLDIKVKICGLSDPEHVAVAADAGAAYIGFVFVEKSPRYVTLEQAAALALDVPPGVAKVALTLDAARGWSTSEIDRRRDTSGLVAAAAAGEIDITGDLGAVPSAGFDEARSKTYTIDTLATLTGQPILLPSGEVNVTAKVGYKLNGIDSTDTRTNGLETSLNRRRALAGVNLGIPLASAREDFLGALGELSLDLGGGIDDLSDFGTLTNWNAGLNWRPSESLSLQASYTVREAAPSLTQICWSHSPIRP